MKTKNCGNCVSFGKWKNDKFGGGICEELDARTKSDHGHKCRLWKAMKYERPAKIRINEIQDGGGS